jgi:ABC-type multidrug transport system ATPase subunit/pSer/pThr/pTyr-binding forkhead associated (FHA) protein/ABC-type multidrug transport system permease subunit
MMNQPFGAASLQCISGPMSGQTFALSKDVQTIGRDNTNDIQIDQSDLSISRRHAEFARQNGQWLVKNVSINNKISVNQILLPPGQQQPVKDHDHITLGINSTFLFLAGAAIAPHQPQWAVTPAQAIARQAPAIAPAPPPFAPAPAPSPMAPTMFAPEPGKTFQANLSTIEVTTNLNSQKQTYPIPPDKQIINIGRLPAPANDIVIDELVISGSHFQIRREQGQLVLIHPHPARPNTANGLFYQGRHYHGSEQFQHVLSNGDVFRVGNEYGTLVTLTYRDSSSTAHTPVPDIPAITLGAQIITIGRRPGNTVVLNHPQVSGDHARLERSGSTYRIIDLGSTNHVYVNGQRVSQRPLNLGDVIRIGPYELTFTGTQLMQHASSKSIRIDAINVVQVGDKSKILLNDISITIPSGKFVALVGGSGAGKTTLMDALNGTRPAKSGYVLYNGQDYYATRASFSTQLGYVPQFDIIHKNLSVERALYYAAKLRLPSDTTNAQIKQRVDEVMNDVGIAQRRKLLISKLSGGQQKRVSIAMELLAKPNVFFLDEPTSGLDPGLDRKMMQLLRNIADKEGHTIILVTHATNNINLCDYVCFLAPGSNTTPGGHLAYFGPPDEAKTFFGQADFADIYNMLEPTETNPDIPKKAEENFKKSTLYQQYVVMPGKQVQRIPPTGLNGARPSAKPPRGNPAKQFRLLSQRYLELLKNDRVNLLVLLLQAPIIAIILMLLINVVLKLNAFSVNDPLHPLPIDAQEVLFIMSFVAVLFGCNNSAREIVKELPIYRRERMVNLGIAPYLFSKIVILGVLCLLQSAVLVIAVNIVAPFQTSIMLPPPLEIYITLSLTSLVGLMIGLLISSLTANSDQANSIIPVILILQIMFSGVVFQLSGFSLALGALIAMHWSMVGMGSTVNLQPRPMGYQVQNPYTGQWHNVSAPFPYGQNVGHLFLAWFALIIMIVIFGLLTGYYLKRKDRLGR